MQIEIMGLVGLLERWRQRPEAPAAELSGFSCHRGRLTRFSGQEIAAKRNELRRLSPESYLGMFPEERPPTQVHLPGSK
jgi:hypothetical protein